MIAGSRAPEPQHVRPAAVAGRFYPARPESLVAQVDGLLAAAGGRDPTSMTGVIVPHAGYRYSGPVAAGAYRLLPETAERVVLIGPSHFTPVSGVGATTAAYWRTPLGDVPVDTAGVRQILAEHPGAVAVDDDSHAREHCLEVQLPFLQRVLTAGWRVLPLTVGHTPADKVAAVLHTALDHGASLLVVSTDLSHYLPCDEARARDSQTAAAIVAQQSDRIGDGDACGAYALRGALTWAGEAAHSLRQLDLRSSGDTAGERDRVVGYGSFLIGPAAA